MKITQQELESRLWEAANALRGPVDPADFKTYVFPMLFWKWISDTWVFEHNAAVDEFGDELNDEIEADFHRFDMPEDTLWSEAKQLQEGGIKVMMMLGGAARGTFQRLSGDDESVSPPFALNQTKPKAFNKMKTNTRPPSSVPTTTPSSQSCANTTSKASTSTSKNPSPSPCPSAYCAN